MASRTTPSSRLGIQHVPCHIWFRSLRPGEWLKGPIQFFSRRVFSQCARRKAEHARLREEILALTQQRDEKADQVEKLQNKIDSLTADIDKLKESIEEAEAIAAEDK